MEGGVQGWWLYQWLRFWSLSPQGWQLASLHRGCRVARQAWVPTGRSSASEGGNNQGGWATATPGGGLSELGSGRLASSG